MESRQINRKPLNVPYDLKIRILGLIDSRDMREYCRDSSETWTVYQYAELTASAPRSMDQKIELLQALMNLPMEEEQSRYLSECCLVAQTAMEFLYKNQQGRAILLVRSMDTEFPEISCMETELVLSYDGFLQYIRKEFTEDGAGDLGEIPERNDFYFILDLYENSESDTLKHIYRYICAPNGEVQYFEKITESIRRNRDNEEAWRLQECTNLFSGRNGLNSWKTPFKEGDILYVDCRPYFLPTYCVIHYVDPEMPSDCCGLRCLFPTHCGYIGEAAVKHGGFLPTGLDDVLASDRQFFSPLYRAEIFQGKLPAKYDVLNTLSEKLKSSPELGNKIDRYFFRDMNDESRYATFTYQIGIADSSDTGTEKEEGVSDRRKDVLAVTEERLFRLLE